MRLTVLGSSGTYPAPGRPASGYLVEQGETSIWVDCGPGTFAALQAIRDFDNVDAVVVSHIHPDHCTDLYAFYHAVRFGASEGRRVRVIVPEGFVDRFVEFLGGTADHPIHQTLSFETMRPDEETEIGPINLGVTHTDHPVPTLGMRFESEGRVLVYSADTGPADDWQTIATGADLFLCEAAFQGSSGEKPWEHHLTAAEAGVIARRAEVARLMLTHLWPTLDPDRSIVEAEETFGRPVELAVAGVTTKV